MREWVGMLILPAYGTWKAGKELRKMALAMEQLTNETADNMDKITAEMVAIRTMAMQNRMALDLLLAEKGGTCAVIGTECFTCIPNNPEQIYSIADK